MCGGEPIFPTPRRANVVPAVLVLVPASPRVQTRWRGTFQHFRKTLSFALLTTNTQVVTMTRPGVFLRILFLLAHTVLAQFTFSPTPPPISGQSFLITWVAGSGDVGIWLNDYVLDGSVPLPTTRSEITACKSCSSWVRKQMCLTSLA